MQPVLLFSILLLPVQVCRPAEQTAARSNNLPLISTTRQFLTLPAVEAKRGYPVRLRGQVTYCDSDWRQLFLQDSTGPIFIPLPDATWNGRAGDLVEVDGGSSVEGEVPVLVGVSVRTVDQTSLPEPADTSPAEIFSGEKVGSTVSLSAIVRHADERNGRLRMEMVSGGRRIRATVRECALTNRTDMIGARVQVKGVCSVNKEDPETFGRFQLFVPSMERVLVLEPGFRDPFATPLAKTTNVIALAAAPGDARRLRLWATVIGQKLGESLVVRDAAGTLRVATSLKTLVSAGDVVEVVGFPSTDQDGKPVLADAVFRAVERGSSSAAWWSAGTNAANPSLPTLRSVAALKALSPEASGQGYPVEVSGVVTFCDRDWQGMFIHDGTNGVFVASGDQEFEVRPGDRVEVRGVSDPGGYAPMISRPRVTVRSHGDLPEADHTSLERLFTGRHDSQWVEVEGVVRSARVNGSHVDLELATDGREFNALIPTPWTGNQTETMVDSKVRLRGVCGVRINGNHQLVGIVIHVPQWSEVETLEAGPPDPFAAAAKPIRELLLFKPTENPGRRVKVRGAVTLATPDGELFIQDSTGGLALQAGSTSQARVGDLVEAVGFPAPGSYNPILERVRIRIAGKQSPPSPGLATATGLMSGTNDAELVSIQARLLDRRTGQDRVELALRAGDVLFDAILDKAGAAAKFRHLQPGSLLELRGVCQVKANAWREVRSFQILLRSSADVRILESPPWWSIRRVMVLLGLAAAGGLGVTAWAVLLGRRVGAQTRVIEERLKREAALEQRYRDLVQNARDVIYTTDLEGHFTSFNKAAERLTGYTQEEALNMRLAQLMAPVDADRMRKRIAAHLAGEEPSPVEVVVHGKDGALRTLEISTSLIRQANQPSAVQGIGRDVTERNLANEKLRQSEAKLRMLSHAVDQSPALIVITDAEGNIEYVNPKFLRVSGYSLEEVMHRKPGLLKSGETPKEHYARLWRTIKAGKEWHGEFRNRKKDGTIFVQHASISPIFDAEGRITQFMGIAEDITQRRDLEVQLRHAQKMESIGQLAAGIAHDYNNILTVMKGNLGFLETSFEGGTDMREALEQISSATDRAANLTRQLLAFSRRQVIQPRVLDVNALVTNLARMLHRLLGEIIVLRLDLDARLPAIEADPGMIEQVVLNLAVNARDAMPNGGRLTISTAVIEVDDAHGRRNPEAQPGSHVCLTVADTGSGMDAAVMERIFEPFFTTKAVGKGTGLGLATAFGIVKQHSGWIEVESRVGAGTTFRVLLPVSTRAIDVPQVMPQAAPIQSGSGTVLVAEDEHALRIMARRTLQRAGYKAFDAGTGPQALSVWAEHKDEIDLLFTDMMMPGGMSGRDLARRLLSEKPSLKVIYTTGYSVELVGEDSEWVRTARLLSKPFEPASLVKAVRECLETKA